jgi:hypothetical protein
MRSTRFEPAQNIDAAHSRPVRGSMSLLALGVTAGALAMYFLDASSGRGRRAQVRDRIAATGRDAASLAQGRVRRAAGYLKGFVATGHPDRVTRSEPQSDEQLHDRIRARLGRVISHPRSVHVDVRQGRVFLSGHIFTRELDDLLHEVRHNAGVKAVGHQLVCHDSAEGIAELQGRTEPRGREQRREASP